MSAYSNDYSKWDALSDSDDDKPQVLLKRADPRKAAHFAAQSAAANGPEPPPAKRYSLEMGNDGPCVVEGDAPPPPDPDAPFETKMAWQNTLSRAFVQIAIPRRRRRATSASTELEKAEDALWPQNTFGGGTDEVLPAEEEIEAAWAAPTDEAAPPRPPAAAKLIWEFDDDVPGKKRLRVELAMRTLASWENGPFLPEADTAGKGLRQHSWSEPKGRRN
ncbi:hypothetical protein JL720_16630 [Aureococcus anophagefferens]|nr:hypothetical protein JL720_16630 [Aureococcus anophagefferens]